MGWLLELLVEGIREMLSQFVIDMMTLVTDMFAKEVYPADPEKETGPKEELV